MDLYWRFLEAVSPKAPRAYCPELAHLQEKFSDVAAIDGSRLDKVAHRLKIFCKRPPIPIWRAVKRRA